MFNTQSQRLLFYLFLVAAFITAISWAYWKYFVALPIMFFFWWLVEAMFLEDGAFMYEPNYAFWREENDTEW